jgi:hypothetical protein
MNENFARKKSLLKPVQNPSQALSSDPLLTRLFTIKVVVAVAIALLVKVSTPIFFSVDILLKLTFVIHAILAVMLFPPPFFFGSSYVCATE